jgi:hypothetical protein
MSNFFTTIAMFFLRGLVVLSILATLDYLQHLYEC